METVVLHDLITSTFAEMQKKQVEEGDVVSQCQLGARRERP